MNSIPESTKAWARRHIGCGGEGINPSDPTTLPEGYPYKTMSEESIALTVAMGYRYGTTKVTGALSAAVWENRKTIVFEEEEPNDTFKYLYSHDVDDNTFVLVKEGVTVTSYGTADDPKYNTRWVDCESELIKYTRSGIETGSDARVRATVPVAVYHSIDPRYLPEGYPYFETREVPEKVLLAETTYSENQVLTGDENIALVAGLQYKVILDGEEYIETAYTNGGDDKAAIGGSSDGKPFYVHYEAGSWTNVNFTESGEHTISVIQMAYTEEVVYPLDRKYIPDDCLGYVPVYDVLSLEYSDVAELAAQLKPFVLRDNNSLYIFQKLEITDEGDCYKFVNLTLNDQLVFTPSGARSFEALSNINFGHIIIGNHILMYGTDGKKYKVTIESGTLTATEVAE